MTDTQWPRFEIFLKDRKKPPHQNVGSVHAADLEMAMQNARDVFVRRPKAISLWIVAADDIFSKTVQEIENEPTWTEGDSGDSSEDGGERYYVFLKKGQRRAMVFVTHVGEVVANSAEQALQRALKKFPREDVYVWWVCPVRAVTASNDDDIESMFAPALDKIYRMPNQYRTLTQMMKVRQEE